MRNERPHVTLEEWVLESEALYQIRRIGLRLETIRIVQRYPNGLGLHAANGIVSITSFNSLQLMIQLASALLSISYEKSENWK